MSLSSANQAVEQTLRNAVQKTQGKTDTPMFRTLTNRMVSSAYGWAVITFFVVFVFLYMTNPPVVQCARAENDMTRPPPNILTITVISAIAAVAVIVCVKFMPPRSGASTR